MKIQGIIQELNKNDVQGLQIEKQKGILTSTWLIYKLNGKYYYFDINQKIEFVKQYCYSEEELINEFKNAEYNIEEVIN
jgi:hypothetical protein